MTMPKFSKTSLIRLATAHPDLQRLFNEVIKHIDCKILEGHRGKKAQHEAFVSGKSDIDWPHGKHNSIPSLAIDAVPYPIDWGDVERFAFFGGLVLGIAAMMGIKTRWGHDWDMDTDLHDQKLIDSPHFELVMK